MQRAADDIGRTVFAAEAQATQPRCAHQRHPEVTRPTNPEDRWKSGLNAEFAKACSLHRKLPLDLFISEPNRHPHLRGLAETSSRLSTANSHNQISRTRTAGNRGARILIRPFLSLVRLWCYVNGRPSRPKST